MKTGPGVTFARATGSAAFFKRMAGLTETAAYVGIPSSSREKRAAQLLDIAGKTKNKKKKARLNKAAQTDVNNAELLFIHEHGSPINKIPARPVLKPAVEADGNRQIIARELESATKAALAGDTEGQKKFMMRAALAGQNAARKWFVDLRNGWAPNAQATIKAKGSDKPLIDTGAMRAAIVGVVREE